MAKTIITVATTGAWPKKENNPNVPMTPSEIADDIYAVWKEIECEHPDMEHTDGKEVTIVNTAGSILRQGNGSMVITVDEYHEKSSLLTL